MVLPATAWWTAMRRGEENPYAGLGDILPQAVEELLGAEVDREAVSPTGRLDRDLRAWEQTIAEQTIAARPSSQRQIIRLALLIGCLATAQRHSEGETITCLPGRGSGSTLRRSPSSDRWLEQAVLSILQSHLLTPQLAELFVTEFRREVRQLSEGAVRKAAGAAQRLAELEREIKALAGNMLVSHASPTLHRMLAELEHEEADLGHPVLRPRRRARTSSLTPLC